MNAALLNNAETAVVTAMRTGHTIQIVPAAPIPMSSAPKPSASFMARIDALNGTNIYRGTSHRPAMVVNTVKGKRGVFWVGYKNGELRVGTCKVTLDGYLHKRNKFDGSFFQSAASLADYNR